MLQNLHQDIPKIVGFLICVLIFGSLFGYKSAMALLTLILIGQVIYHPDILGKIPFFGGNV
jgi:hypothetical protein